MIQVTRGEKPLAESANPPRFCSEMENNSSHEPTFTASEASQPCQRCGFDDDLPLRSMAHHGRRVWICDACVPYMVGRLVAVTSDEAGA